MNKTWIGQNDIPTEVSLAGHAHPSYAAHAADYTNPHKVMGSQVQVSDTVAELLGMVSPGFVDTALSTLFDGIDNINGILDGSTSQQTRWKTYKWSYYLTGSSISAGGEYSCSLNVKVYDSITQDPATGVISEGNLIATITNAHPSDLTPGTYIRGQSVSDSGYTSSWSDLKLVTDNVADDSESAAHYAGPTDTTPTYSYTYWITGLQALNVYEEFIEVVKSENDSAYPDDDWVNNIHYIKQVGASVSIPKIAYYTYTGTGKYGSANPTILTFDFDPLYVKVVGIYTHTDKFEWGDEYSYNSGSCTSNEGSVFEWIKGKAIGEYAEFGRVYSTAYSGYGSYITYNTPYTSTTHIETTYDSTNKCLKLTDTSDARRQINDTKFTYTVIAIG